MNLIGQLERAMEVGPLESYTTRRKLRWLVWFLTLLVSMVLILFPLYWMLVTSVKPEVELFNVPTPVLPVDPVISNYQDVFATDIPLWYRNTIIVTTGVVALTTTTATLGGYGLARLNLSYKKTFARIILFGYMFPPILLSIPMFILWRQIGLLNSLVGVIFAQTATTLPFSIWLMWQFFQTVPYSLEESAMVGGSSRFRAFVDIALPLAKPGMIAIAIFSFAIAWGAFTIPSILILDNTKWVLVQGLFNFTVQESVEWGQLMAACTLLVFPTVLFVYFLQKYILRGFEASRI